MKYSFLFLVLLISSLAVRAEKFYLDPLHGNLANDGSAGSPWSSLEEVINAGLIATREYDPLPYDPSTSTLIPKNPDGQVHAGDTLVLMEGLHGNVFLNNYVNSLPITILGMEGHTAIIKKVHLRACRNWHFENVTISSEAYGIYLNDILFFIESHGWQGPSSHIEIRHCELYSSENPWESAEEWNTLMSDGFYIKADSIKATHNLIRNINFGLQAVGNYIEATDNQIINFAGDGIRMVGSNILVKHNLIKNCYDVNDNHDDGIQSWAGTNGVIANDNQVIGNIIINTDDTTRPLNGPLQGIGCFDGYYKRWKVINNLILVNHWHGITFLGAIDCEIINNTVLDLTPDITPGGSWIRISDKKDGSPSSGCLVANNVANKFNVDGELYSNLVLNDYDQYEENFMDYTQFDFHLRPGSSLINAADPIYAPNTDIEGNERPQGEGPDIGAYEYVSGSSVPSKGSLDDLLLYPNPFSDYIYLKGEKRNLQVEIRDLSQHLHIKSATGSPSGLYSIDLSGLPGGVYFLTVRDSDRGEWKSFTLVKN